MASVNAIVNGIAGGEHQNWQRFAFAAQATTQRHAIHAGQADIENHQVDVAAMHSLPGICRGKAALHDPSFHFQIFGNIGKDVGVVINNQNFDGHGKVPSSGFVAGSLETSRFFHAEISPLLALHHGL